MEDTLARFAAAVMPFGIADAETPGKPYMAEYLHIQSLEASHNAGQGILPAVRLHMQLMQAILVCSATAEQGPAEGLSVVQQSESCTFPLAVD